MTSKFLCYCNRLTYGIFNAKARPPSALLVFQERPELPPTQAQARARNMPPEEYSYVASILRLLRNRPFILLILTYGG